MSMKTSPASVPLDMLVFNTVIGKLENALILLKELEEMTHAINSKIDGSSTKFIEGQSTPGLAVVQSGVLTKLNSLSIELTDRINQTMMSVGNIHLKVS